MDKISILKRINETLKEANRVKRLKEIEDLKEEGRIEEEASKLAYALAMNDRLVEELEQVRKVISEGSNIIVESPNVNVNVPDVNVPEIRVPDIYIPEIKLPVFNIPEIKIPTIKVPKPEVTVNVPEIKFPKFDAPIVNIPDAVFLKGIDRTSPLPVIMVDGEGKLFQPVSSGGGSSQGKVVEELRKQTGFGIPPYDTQVIDESASPTVVITYKRSGATVATKTISVSGSTTTIGVTIP